jgi:hypothetical protein
MRGNACPGYRFAHPGYRHRPKRGLRRLVGRPGARKIQRETKAAARRAMATGHCSLRRRSASMPKPMKMRATLAYHMQPI